MNNIYKAYVCSGDRESGSYACYGKDYKDAALNFGNHWNRCGFPTYGNQWEEIGNAQGYPKQSMFLKDNKGNRILLIATGEQTTFDPTK